MKKYPRSLGALALFLMMLGTSLHPALAQEKDEKENKKEIRFVEALKTSLEKDKNKKIEDLIKSSKVYDGLFTIYQDTITGSLKMLVTEKQLDEEFIYFSQIADGVVDASSFRGAYRDSKVIKVVRYFDKIQLITQNTSFYFDPDHPLSKASEANISNSVTSSEKILASDTVKGHYLIKADNIFLKETLSPVKPAKHPILEMLTFSLGSLDKNKTKVNGIRNYPENTDLEIEYVYSKSSASQKGSKGVADARNISIKVWHSLMKMPENNYQVRLDDPRVGFFATQVNDMTSTSATPYRDLIHRWHLEKKDPRATLSDPVAPIVWWIENTTPEDIRPIVREAGEKWNEAFEQIGIKNAVVIKQQPDSADWDAGDIRYNVLRWTSSPDPIFNGYGPSFVNPKTGQILGADIMLEFNALASNLKGERVFEKAALNLYQEADPGEENPFAEDPFYCTAGLQAQTNQMFGLAALKAMSGLAIEEKKMVKEFIYFLVLHEMGHTLGLNHNMKASQLHNLDEINDEVITSETGLVGSVMDYPAINFALDRDHQGQYWPTKPGPYDFWAIEFGYKELESPEELQEILAKSTLPELSFGNDADDMRWPGKAIDPRVNINDLSSDAISYSIQRMELTKKVSQELLEKYAEPGKSYHELRNAYLVLTGQQYGAANVISRYIGGVYVDRAFVGQENAAKPFTPVEDAKQRMALRALKDHVFAPDAFTVPDDLYNYLQIQRRGYDHFTSPEDPKIHGRILTIQESVLRHLLHYNTLQRISDSELYGNTYTLPEFMNDLNSAMFKDDIYGNVNSFRQNLQLAYVNRLITMINGKRKDRYTHLAKSMAIYNLNNIKKMSTGASGDLATKAHKAHLLTLIDNALELMQ